MSVRPVILIDNYDSFTYNLYQCLCLITPEVLVFRNDRITVAAVARMGPEYLIISPGPKGPKDAGISKELIRQLAGACKILGVCLGHQCINEVFGGRTVRAPLPWHGKTSTIAHDGLTIYAGLPPRLEVARYHSLMVDPTTLSPELIVSSRTDDGVIMGIRHRWHTIEGVQFHPESFMTEYGQAMLRNFFVQVSHAAA